MNNKLLLVFLACVLLEFSCVECVVGGHTAIPNAAPYMVSIQNPTHICGGVLVGSNWVLTTASCVQGESNLKVMVGSHRLLSNAERVGVSSTILHSQYNPTSGINNVALLKLVKSVVSSQVSTISLNDAAVTSGIPTVFYGWGSPVYGIAAKSNELQTLYQKTLSASDCTKKYQNIGGLATGYICAHIQPGQAACSKDQGGPLVSYSSGKLLGIYDHGILCSGAYPDVFVSVFTFKSWIETTMANS
ncbi:chymotrypsin-1-like [Topomyia yanbarensis]|uniref:chymotrypsin-1-like n=1 Tax=Topomyia yanbarensis TaxID=2498891 RepID=UPI00273C344C|nr:chymotrypsin-1-like [Topomyia yanbarensis]